MLLATIQQAFDLTIEEFEQWYKAQNPQTYKPAYGECKGVFYNKLVKNLDACNECYLINKGVRDTIGNDDILELKVDEGGKIILIKFNHSDGKGWHWSDQKEKLMARLGEASRKSDRINLGLGADLDSSILAVKDFKF